MRLLSIVCFLILVTSTVATLSTMFPSFFQSRSTSRPKPLSVTNTVRRDFTRRTMDFFGKKEKKKQKTRLSLQVSLGPMIFPESVEETTPLNQIQTKPTKFKGKTKTHFKKTTTTNAPDYENYDESEEDILFEPKTLTTTTTTANPYPFKFLQHLTDKFPKVHEWIYDENNDQVSSESTRQARMPKTIHLNFKKKPMKVKQQLHKLKTSKPTNYRMPQKPTSFLTPPRLPPSPRFPRPTPTSKKPKQTTTPPFEEVEDIQAEGSTLPRPPSPKRKRKPITFEQFAAQPIQPLQVEKNFQPSGQNGRPTNLYGYPKPQEVTKEFFFYEPPKQFAPSNPKPYQPKPPLLPKKQYKVIFIKAPEPEPPIIPNIPQIQPAPEQKTLIYVVAKKPDDAPNVTINVPVETPTEKPDVFFIRYKVTTTTPVPDESEQQVLPAGFDQTTRKPNSGYKYPKPKPRPQPTTQPPIDESEEDVLPGGQPITEPPDEDEEEVLPGGQEPMEPTDEDLPSEEQEEEVLPGGQEHTDPPTEEPNEDILPGEQLPTEPSKEYLPPNEQEEDILPAEKLPPPTPTYIPPTYYLPPKFEPNNYYLPLQTPVPSYGPPPTVPSWQNEGYNYLPPATTYGSQYKDPNTGNYNNFKDYYSPSPNNFYNTYNPSNYHSPQKTYDDQPTQSYEPHFGSHYGQNTGKTNYGSHYNGASYGILKPKGEYSNNAYNYHPNTHASRYFHTVHSPRPIPFPLQYNDRLLQRQGVLDDDPTLDSILFSSLGLSPFS